MTTANYILISNGTESLTLTTPGIGESNPDAFALSSEISLGSTVINEDTIQDVWTFALERDNAPSIIAKLNRILNDAPSAWDLKLWDNYVKLYYSTPDETTPVTGSDDTKKYAICKRGSVVFNDVGEQFSYIRVEIHIERTRDFYSVNVEEFFVSTDAYGYDTIEFPEGRRYRLLKIEVTGTEILGSKVIGFRPRPYATKDESPRYSFNELGYNYIDDSDSKVTWNGLNKSLDFKTSLEFLGTNPRLEGAIKMTSDYTEGTWLAGQCDTYQLLFEYGSLAASTDLLVWLYYTIAILSGEVGIPNGVPINVSQSGTHEYHLTPPITVKPVEFFHTVNDYTSMDGTMIWLCMRTRNSAAVNKNISLYNVTLVPERHIYTNASVGFTDVEIYGIHLDNTVQSLGYSRDNILYSGDFTFDSPLLDVISDKQIDLTLTMVAVTENVIFY